MSSTKASMLEPTVPSQWSSCFKVARLPKVGFVPEEDSNAFGFLDPALVVRGCHMVPAFAAGRTSELLKTVAPTAARSKGEVDDWANFYVTIWVDRDMFMRYLGGGVGHIAHCESALPAEDRDIDVGVEPETSSEPCQETTTRASNVNSGEEDNDLKAEDDEDSDSDSNILSDSDDDDSSAEGEGSDGAYDDEDEVDDGDFADV
ncbi:hypothetical protein MSAN_02412400 [Mycena sanguinolenta]|uniref:Uncharacterized protein n=1 Tax=Mycena sanguinolenta TaxID=230812 RepID=A0A8H6X375_9AGAR|nr:hypothetical protein MSAN_02412400 [Mycena sanguinolenta]